MPPPPIVISTERIETHRRLAIEHTRAVLDHYLELQRRLEEAQRRHEDHRRASGEVGPRYQSQLARDEEQAWERWIGLMRDAIVAAEVEVVAVVHAWDEAHRSRNKPEPAERGVLHKGKLYLAVPAAEAGSLRLSVVELRDSMNLDNSVAVVDLLRSP